MDGRSPASEPLQLPRLMSAVLLKGHGGLEQLEYREDVPVPAPGPGELLVRIGAAGVNNTDINTRIGWYSKSVLGGTDERGTDASGRSAGPAAAIAGDGGWLEAPLTFPRIQGADGCGQVVAVAADVDAERIGERVLIEPVFRRPRHDAPDEVRYFGSECDGAFAQFARVPAVHAHRIRSGLSDVELASFPCAYSAAENMLQRAQVGVGECVLITGASGGVGSAAVQLARRRGARVLAVAGASKAKAVAELGASRVIERGADLRRELGAQTVDVVIDVVGGAAFASLLGLLRRGGRYAVAGAIEGPRVELDLRTLYLKDLRLMGCTVLDPGVFRALLGYIERAEIRPLVAQTYALRDIARAQQALLRREHVGKIVLVP
jgi:NADPH:quinone reductase-like Zn-dependent oxidoreductase